jgi:four helix bundle protein
MSMQSNILPQIERTKITSYRYLVVWARAMDIVEMCYKLSKQIPQSEINGLTSQIRRAAVSIPANIGEGHGRKTLGECIQHLSVANVSLKELETHLLIADRLHYVKRNDLVPALRCCEEIGRMLASLIQKLRQRSSETGNLSPTPCHLFVPECFHRIESRGLHGWINAKKQADRHRYDNPQKHRPERHGRRQSG